MKPIVHRFSHDPTFGFHVDQKTLEQLEPNQYLGDEIMELYPKLITEEHGDLAPTINTLSSFFFTWMLSRFNFEAPDKIIDSVRRMRSYYKPPFSKIDTILMPIHMDLHWSLVVITLDRTKSNVEMFHLDSLFGHHKTYIIESALKRYYFFNMYILFDLLHY